MLEIRRGIVMCWMWIMDTRSYQRANSLHAYQKMQCYEIFFIVFPVNLEKIIIPRISCIFFHVFEIILWTALKVAYYLILPSAAIRALRDRLKKMMGK
jgi:hypothetical protein